MDSNLHYYGHADYLIDKIILHLFRIFQDQQEWVLTRKSFLHQHVGNLMGFKSNRSYSLFVLLNEVELLRNKTYKYDNTNELHGYLDEFEALIKDYQNRFNIKI